MLFQFGTVGTECPLVAVAGESGVHATNSGLPSNGRVVHLRGSAGVISTPNAIANSITAPVASGDFSIIRTSIQIEYCYTTYVASSGYRTVEPTGGDGAIIDCRDTTDITIISRIRQCPRYGAGGEAPLLVVFVSVPITEQAVIVPLLPWAIPPIAVLPL